MSARLVDGTRRLAGVVAAAFAVLSACATPLAETHTDLAAVAAMLPSIVDGVAAVAEVEATHGAPTARFDGGRVLVWTLLLVEPDLRIDVDGRGVMRPTPDVDRKGGAARSARRAALAARGALRTVPAADVAAREVWPVWREAEYHLVVEADASGRVARHSFQRVLP